MREHIRINPAAFKRFSEAARAPGNYESAHAGALAYLQLSPYYATADDCHEAGGGDELTGVRDNGPRGGQLISFGDLFLRSICKTYNRFLPEHVVDGPAHHFDGRPPTPIKRVRDDWRAAYALRHHDALEAFDEAIAMIAERHVMVSREDVSDELAAHIEAHATDRRYYAWLAAPEGRMVGAERAAS